MIYFDNSATTGVKPPQVVKAVNTALLRYSANPGRSGHEASVKAADAVFKAREKIAEFFGATGPEKVVFTMNCTHSINCVLKGILRQGDHIIVSSLEHNAVMRPLSKMGISYDIAQVSFTDDSETVEVFESLIRPNTRMIFCTAASNVCGKILPLKQIGELCKAKGLLFGVDAAQTAGVLPINMQELNIDYLCIAPHKGLYAPMGIGVLIAEKHIQDTIIEGGTGTNSLDLFQPELLPERLESGTVNISGIMGVSAGIDFVKGKGIEKIYRHEMMLIKALYRELKKMPDIILYTKEPEIGDFAPVLSFNINGVSSNEAAQLLSDKGIAVRGGLHCAPIAHKALGTLESGTVRVSVSAFNTLQEIKRFCEVLKNAKNFKKI